MSDTDLDDDLEGDLEDYGPPKRFAGKKLVLFVILPVLLLGGGAGVMMSGVLDSGESKEVAAEPEEAHAEETPAAAQAVFYDLPVLLVNLNSNSRRPSFLKIKVSLELENAAVASRIDSLTPRIIDNFQVYLRELRIDDLRGSAGIYRLREELLARVNASVGPDSVKNVLFKEVLVQ